MPRRRRSRQPPRLPGRLAGRRAQRVRAVGPHAGRGAVRLRARPAADRLARVLGRAAARRARQLGGQDQTYAMPACWKGTPSSSRSTTALPRGRELRHSTRRARGGRPLRRPPGRRQRRRERPRRRAAGQPAAARGRRADATLTGLAVARVAAALPLQADTLAVLPDESADAGGRAQTSQSATASRSDVSGSRVGTNSCAK